MTSKLNRWPCLLVALVLAGCGGDEEKETAKKKTEETETPTQGSDPKPPPEPVERPNASTARRAVTKAQVDKVKLRLPRPEVEKILGPPGRVRDPDPKSGTVCTVYGAALPNRGGVATDQVWLICYDRAGKVNIVTNPATG